MKVSKEQWNISDRSFGPLLPYIKDDNVTDVNYNGRHVWIEDLKKGRYMAKVQDNAGINAPLVLEKGFVNRFCTLIADVVSQQFNKDENVLEAETEELRISCIHDSVANTGTSISIRKTPAVRRMTKESMLEENYCTEDVLYFLINCIKAKLNVVICGLTGAGKTELLKFFTSYIPLDEKVMTIEDNLEIHYSKINPGSNCVELKVDEKKFTYTDAIKASLRQNPQWILLSEARSVEVQYLLEAFSTGHHGLTTLHLDDCRKLIDRIENMLHDPLAASRIENDIFMFINVAIVVRKKVNEDGQIYRYIEQVGIFDRVDEENKFLMLIEDGKFVSKELTRNIMKKFERASISKPFM